MRYAPISTAVVGAILSMVLNSASASDEAPSGIRITECQILLSDDRLLASGQSGIVDTMNVREGDRVRKGQLLAELDSSVPKATLAVATLQAENDVSIRFAKESALLAQADYDTALAANKQFRDTFVRMQLEKLRLQETRSVLEVEVSGHEFEVNKLRRDEANALVASYRIVAPMDGIITRVFKSPGEAVQVGESLLQCQSTDTVHVEANVKIGLLRWVTKGRTVKVIPVTPNPSVEHRTGTSNGTVFFVGVLADLTTDSVRALIEVDNTSGLLLAGTDCAIEIQPDLAPVAAQSVESRPAQRE